MLHGIGHEALRLAIANIVAECLIQDRNAVLVDGKLTFSHIVQNSRLRLDCTTVSIVIGAQQSIVHPVNAVNFLFSVSHNNTSFIKMRAIAHFLMLEHS